MQSTVEKLLAEKLDISKAEADRTFNAVLEALSEAIVQDPELRLRGFGTFKLATQAARTARNPITGEPIAVPAKTVVRFKPSAKLKQAVVSVEL